MGLPRHDKSGLAMTREGKASQRLLCRDFCKTLYAPPEFMIVYPVEFDA
jgi:hypothetical protein